MKSIGLFFLTAILIGVALIETGRTAQAAGAPTDRFSGDGGVSKFYRWKGPLPAKPGTMLRREPLPADLRLDHAATAERVLYSSTDGIDGNRPIAVSGAVFFPKGRMPRGGWPIIAWAHGTTGIADVCAPSWRGRSARDAAYLNTWLDRGFAVVATDYQGLGTPGIHPYILFRPEAYSVLDIVRASLRAYPEKLGNKVIVVGQSQGAGAALGAGFLAPDYSPQVHLLGTVATGVVAEVASPGGAPQVPLATSEEPGDVDAAYEILFFLGTARALDPSISPQDYISEAGQPLLDAALHSCFGDLVKTAREKAITVKALYTRDIAPLNALQTRFGSFPGAKFKAPVFIGTGLADVAAGTASQYNFASALCFAGSRVETHYYPGMTHAGAVSASLADSLPFVQRLITGETVSGNCATLQPPGPTQAPDRSKTDND